MTSAFAHFDASHQENFCAALLLLVMEIEEPMKHTVVTLSGQRGRNAPSP